MNATTVIVPGMRDRVEAHWQTWLASEIPDAVSVTPLGRQDLSLNRYVNELEACVRQVDGPVQLVAHSAGCITVAYWASQTQFAHRVQSAFLAAPPDMDKPLPSSYPQPDELERGGWLPVPRQTLPFPTWVGLSDNDPLGRLEDIRALAEAWGAQAIELGEVGHINPPFGFGPWPEVLPILRRLRVAS